MRVVAVAMATVVPCDDPPARISQQGSEYVERPGEVGATVHQHEDRIALVPPFVHRDADTIGVDPVMTIGGTCAGERPDRIHVMRLRRSTVESGNEAS